MRKSVCEERMEIYIDMRYQFTISLSMNSAGDIRGWWREVNLRTSGQHKLRQGRHESPAAAFQPQAGTR